MTRRWREFIAATCLLTRLPLGGLARLHPPPGACVWAYPLVGAVAGAVAAAVLAALTAAGLGALPAAFTGLGALVLVTGGLHEDGLADTADGFGGGATRARKLAIMRDSLIGSYGALALVFSVLLRGVSLAGQRHPELALVLSGALARGTMLLPLMVLRPAREDGLAASLAGSRGPARAGLALTLPFAWFAPQAALAAAAAALAVTMLAARQVGGYTGDVLGAAEQAAECVALAALPV